MHITKIEITGDSGNSYTISASVDGVVRCSCPAWKFQKVPAALRSCKHIAFVKKAVA